MQVLQSLGYAVPPVSFVGGNLIELATKNDLNTQLRWMTEVGHSTVHTPPPKTYYTITYFSF
jgi:hypothetical protein